MQLWAHQQRALDVSICNGFASGVHAHATGSGKSILGHALVRAYAEMHKGELMVWVCEQAGVIAEIFSRPVARRGLLVCDLVSRKPNDWWWCVQSALCWGKPVLVIVNRAFLVSQKRYEKLRSATLGLVLHDECHSGAGKTTQAFYTWLTTAHPNARVIGLSATPPSAAHAPHPALSKVLSRYSIYDATVARTIVPLRVCWSETRLTAQQSATLTHQLAVDAGVRKIIVWCGIIDHCYTMATLWARVFGSAWLVCCDTSRTNPCQWHDYAAFVAAKEQPALLFCAAKHREGSDIDGLGMGVFVDGVEKRGAAVFVQCAGRVLRRGTAPHKPCGWILDLRARDGMELCDRVGEFLQLPLGVCPWTFGTHTAGEHTVRSLTLCETEQPAQQAFVDPTRAVTTDDLRARFVRPVPTESTYTTRLAHELQLLDQKQLNTHLVRALDVLALAGTDVPHVTRGSCGSSLVCYLLGLSHVDPVEHGICFARFLNEFRDTLPDVDFDFPYNRRADIFLRMALKWTGKVARISNHVHFHEKSALRAVLRAHGHKSNVPAGEMHRFLSGLDPCERQHIAEDAEALDGTFHCYSLHCGGVVYYPEGVPDDALLDGKRGKLLAQVKLDKRDVAGDGRFKIDVLSSRALAQLVDALHGSGVPLTLDHPPFTAAMVERLANGDNLGVTLAESPLCRAELRKVQPTCVGDIAACLALIRPAARDSDGTIVYDDDAIHIIAKTVGCTDAQADAYRRGLAKKKPDTVAALVQALGQDAYDALAKQLGSLSLYGFCKAHAMSYAQLVTWLMWCKVERPQAFWRGALNHCHSSYRPWVHLWEAWKVGVDPFDTALLRNDVSIYASARKKDFGNKSTMAQLRAHWYWDVRKGFVAGCYTRLTRTGTTLFRGVIANHRRLSDRKVALCVGCGDTYLDMTVHTSSFHLRARLATGEVNSEGVATNCTFA